MFYQVITVFVFTKLSKILERLYIINFIYVYIYIYLTSIACAYFFLDLFIFSFRYECLVSHAVLIQDLYKIVSNYSSSVNQ